MGQVLAEVASEMSATNTSEKRAILMVYPSQDTSNSSTLSFVTDVILKWESKYLAK
jgi:hypothetical protein